MDRAREDRYRENQEALLLEDLLNLLVDLPVPRAQNRWISPLLRWNPVGKQFVHTIAEVPQKRGQSRRVMVCEFRQTRAPWRRKYEPGGVSVELDDRRVLELCILM